MGRDYYEMPKSALNILKEKKILIIIPPSEFSDEEFTYVYAYLRNAKLDVRVASTESSAMGIMGTKVKPNIKFSDAKTIDFDAILILGECTGLVKHNLSENNEILNLIKNSNKKKNIIAATGMATKIIAEADVIKGKLVTAWRDPKLVDLIKKHGGSYVWEPVVSDENLITADGPSSVKVFTEMLIDALTR
jgi:protease I